MDTFAVRLKWEGNPVAIVFRVDKDYYKDPPLRLWTEPHHHQNKADRLLVWVNNDWEYVTSRDIL